MEVTEKKILLVVGAVNSTVNTERQSSWRWDSNDPTFPRFTLTATAQSVGWSTVLLSRDLIFDRRNPYNVIMSTVVPIGRNRTRIRGLLESTINFGHPWIIMLSQDFKECSGEGFQRF